MKKLTVLVLVCVFALSACAPAAPNSVPPVDVAGTVDAIAKTAIALTQAAQPSSPNTPVQVTASSTLVEPSATNVPSTNTPVPNLTTTPATATSGPADSVIPTATFTPVIPGSPSLTPTLGVLTYGTLPPANTPYTRITLINKSKRQAYISLQVVTDQGYTIIEYPVKGTVRVKIPVGSYTYVVWVGGRQIVGYFNVSKNDEPTILIYKDKVIVNKNFSSYP